LSPIEHPIAAAARSRRMMSAEVMSQLPQMMSR
jgi:hypothetical protein